ncbi:MAG: ATP-binding protein [archaeon]
MTKFTEMIIERVNQTIKRFDLLKKPDKVCVALSGGKDSLTILYILYKLGYKVSALCIHEGIEEYRRKTLDHAISFCKQHNIDYKVVSFKEEFGKGMPFFLKSKELPCTVCGTLRRYLLNKHSKGFDKIATGHNMDDEAQVVLMNLFRAHVDLMPRLGPKSKKQKGFTQKIKPLYLVLEKETERFVKEAKISTCGCRCPYVVYAYRKQIRELLDEYEKKHPGTKKNIIERFLKILPKLNKSTLGYGYCKLCGEPSRTDVCKVCRIVGTAKKH